MDLVEHILGATQSINYMLTGNDNSLKYTAEVCRW